MRMAFRLERMGISKYHGLTRKSGKRTVWTGRIFLDEQALRVPYEWKRPRAIFVNSMSDLFHEDVPIEFIARVWSVMRETPQHTYQILTKRSDRMQKVLIGNSFDVLPNVWLGTSVENGSALPRLEYLRNTPAAIRFVSFEPLLGSVADVNLTDIHWAIVGGESGPNARPMQETWVAEILDNCQRSNVAFFFKQWGGRNKKVTGRAYQGRVWDDRPVLSI